MKVETVKKPERLSKSNAHWLEIKDRFLALNQDNCLRITELTDREIKALRQYAYRDARAMTFLRTEGEELVLYLYKGKERQ